MALSTILLIVLIVILIGAIPTWPYSGNWGWSPVAIILVILLIVFLSRGAF